jgi:spermidine synthase
VRSVRRVELLRDLDRATGWVLLVDGVEQSYVDEADPTHLEFEYMQHMALVVDAVLPAPRPLTACHLGGGALTMPRWVAHTRPGSTQRVVESSADVLGATAALEPVADVDVDVEEASAAIAELPRAAYDLVVWDLYDGPLAVRMMRRALRRRGLLLLNVSDVRPFEVVRPVLAAMLSVAGDVALLAEPATLRGRRSGNCVLAATVGRALPVDQISRRAAAAPVRGRLVAGEELTTLVGDAVPATAEAPLPRPDAISGRAFL